MEVRSCNHFAVEKQTYSECVSVVLVIQLAICMRHIILSSVICLAVLYFSTLCHKGYDFEEKFLNIKYVVRFPLQRLSKTDKHPLLLQDFNKT